MEATVIDTLRYADRLKAAGVESNQAEAMSRALNDEIAGGVATKDDLDRAVIELKGEIAKVDAKVDGMDAKFEARFAAMDAKFEAMDAKVDSMDAKFDHQGRYVFLVLAVIAALGLYNAVAPHFFVKAPGTTDARSAPAAPAPAPGETATLAPALSEGVGWMLPASRAPASGDATPRATSCGPTASST